MRVGLISDTHGLLRPAAIAALRGVSLILHAGDIGKPEVLEGLRAIAPVLAIRGNNDTGIWARDLPVTLLHEIANTRFYVVHALADLDRDPVRDHISVVVSGHSHRPEHRVHDGVHYVNPGSAGPRRFKLPVSLARLELKPTEIAVDIVELDDEPTQVKSR